MRGIDPDNYT